MMREEFDSRSCGSQIARLGGAWVVEIECVYSTPCVYMPSHDISYLRGNPASSLWTE